MARTPNKLTKVEEPKVNEPRLQAAEAAAGTLAVIDQEAQERARALAAMLRYEGSTQPDALENGAREAMRRINMGLFELGGYLLLLRETCKHGDFLQRLGRLDLEPRVAQQYMQITRRFSNANSNSHLSDLGKTKLLEMLVLDNEQIEELMLTGQTGELALDDVATMSVKELRAALRQAKQDNDFAGEQLAKERARADKAEKKLRGKVPEVLPLDERITPFQVEITERQSLLEKGVAAHLEAVAALDTWWTEEVTARPDYDPESPVDMPKPVGLVLMHLVGSANRLAAMVGQLQHTLEERFGGDIAAASQYLMQEPAAAGQVDA